MSLNYSKTKALISHSGTNSRPLSRDIEIDGHSIEHIPHFKILGVYFDSILTWKYNTDTVTTRFSSATHVIYKCRNVLNCKWLLTLYNVFFSTFHQLLLSNMGFHNYICSLLCRHSATMRIGYTIVCKS